MEPPPNSNSSPSFETIHESESKDEEYWTISGKNPFFDVIVSKSNIHPHYNLIFPIKMHSVLPSVSRVPAIVRHRGKEWNMVYNGKLTRFSVGWRNFVNDNEPKLGDAIVFELLEASHEKLVLRVQILSGEIPPEMLEKIST